MAYERERQACTGTVGWREHRKQERVAKRRHASSITKREALNVPASVHSVNGHITDQCDTLRFTVYTRNDFVSASHVHEIACVRMDVPGATTIYHECNAATSSSASMAGGVTALAADKQCSRAHGRASGDGRCSIRWQCGGLGSTTLAGGAGEVLLRSRAGRPAALQCSPHANRRGGARPTMIMRLK
eukprot:5880809-Pleurochrysis_carterae.AAC.1